MLPKCILGIIYNYNTNLMTTNYRYCRPLSLGTGNLDRYRAVLGAVGINLYATKDHDT